MRGAYRTPSPAAEAYLSSAEDTPHTSSGIYSRIFDDASMISQKEQPETPEVIAAPPLTSTPRPRTPTFERIKNNWHGLPSPQTPSCKNGFSKGQSSGQMPGPVGDRDDWEMNESWTTDLPERRARPSFSPITPRCDSSSTLSGPIDLLDLDQFTPLTSIEGETTAALEPSSSSSTRRSTRLRDKSKSQAVYKSNEKSKAGKPRVKHPSPTPQQADSIVITQAAPTESTFNVAVTSNVELPALYSAQWQLMYPPGGSTHPAYPWPNADPRLVFHTLYVPLNNGLPDTSYVHDLALPMGWHQACWSGLHPVVFDPNRQAFKLTPVGPLPLTSEEVHQGGLQDYIPGGRLHPEFGMLPLLSALSDGSDAEVYNFDGVDWVLPWAHVGNIPGFEQSAFSPVSSNSTALAKHALPAIQLPPRYLEARDCPNDVFDLQDGWRWLRTIEQVPSGIFIPTPGRKWHGTGVRRTSCQTKQPIAALMATTIAENSDDNAERYLGNQNYRDFCPFKSVATPVYVNISLLGDIEFTLVELMCYFPQHYQWRKAGERMVRAGLSPMDISTFVSMSRRLPGASVCSSKSVSYHIAQKFKNDSTKQITQSSTETTSYTAEEWTYSVWETTDYPLLALTHGLVELPSGVDAGPLTTLIKWVRDQGKYQLMLSEVPALLNETNINALIDPGDGADPDKEILPRHINALKADRRRILKETQDLKEGEGMKTEGADAAVALGDTRTKKRKLA